MGARSGPSVLTIYAKWAPLNLQIRRPGQRAVTTYTAEGVALDYCFASLRFAHVGGTMLFRLPTSLMHIVCHFGIYKGAWKMGMDPVLVGLASYRVTETGWSSSDRSDDFAYYCFATGIVHGYPAVNIAPVKRQKVDDGPFMAVMSPYIGVNWLRGVARKLIFEAERDYWQFRDEIDDDAV